MEVHHHAHTARRKWTHYFWEFLMLFLAVFCGFLAEYQLEHVIENQREKKFIVSLYEDLKNDTTDLSQDIPFWKQLLLDMDTLRMEIEKPEAKRNKLLLYRKAARMRTYDNFQYHDRTIDQLKNAGNFRLIRKTVVADSLINYDSKIRSQLRDQEMQSNAIYQQLNFLQDKIFNSKFYGIANRGNYAALDSAFKISSAGFEVAAGNESALYQYYNHIQFYSQMTSFRLGTSRSLLRKATNLLELMKNKYHLSEKTPLEK